MWTIFWNSILLAFVGIVFLRLGGRKSISQMTIPQLVIVLSLGTILGTEVSGKGLASTILALGTFVFFLIAVEWVTLRWNRVETLLKGRAIPVIHQGELLVDNLRKIRMSVDDVEKRLRMAGISHITDVKSGTIEDNGELGYELYPHAKPLTRMDLESMLDSYFPRANKPATPSGDNIFAEVETHSHRDQIPQHLQ